MTLTINISTTIPSINILSLGPFSSFYVVLMSISIPFQFNLQLEMWGVEIRLQKKLKILMKIQAKRKV